jgi:HlyD family secretion protein
MTPAQETNTHTVRLTTILLAAALVAACGRDAGPDAYGNFEADAVTVSAEATGQLIRLDAREGERVAAGAVVGLVDTTPLALQREELLASRATARSRAGDAAAQVPVLQARLVTARREYERTGRLAADQAATRQQLDRAEGEVRVLEEQIRAARAQAGTAARDVPNVDARLATLDERMRESRVVNPVAGTVLASYADRGEFVQAGQPLYKVADLGALTFRGYVSGAQLARVRVGQQVLVAVDVGADARRSLPGTVTWISSEAEFTPTPVQTREERTELVYAVKVRVPNPGGLAKIGMPGELRLPGATVAAR